MAKLSILAGATSQSVNVFIQDSTKTDGSGKAGLAFNTAGWLAYYTFTSTLTSSTVINLATLAAPNSAYSSGGFKEIDPTNMIGLYRLDIPNAALATSKGRAVTIMLSGPTAVAPCILEIELTGWDNQEGVRGGMTALPNAAANAAGGLLISTAGALDMDEMNVDIEAIQASTAGLTFTVTNQVDANVLDWKSATAPAMTGDAFARLGAPVGASISADIAEVEGETDLLLAGVTVTTNNDKTGYSLTAGQLFIKKNVALSNFPFFMTDATTHAPKTGVTVTATRKIDSGSFGACTNAPTEVANGWYTIDLAQGDLNGTTIALRFTGSGADDRNITIITQA